MNILSIDWDFFFPNTECFDWGFNEIMNTHLMDIIWCARAFDFPLPIYPIHDNNPAIEILNPDPNIFNNFWRNIDITIPSTLIITESHQDLGSLLLNLKYYYLNIWNLDAHHDIHYVESPEPQAGDIKCDNWVYHLLKKEYVKKYTLIYPDWRKDTPESSIENVKHYIDTIQYWSKAKMPGDFDIVFICRSPHWTPPWSDNCWLHFIRFWEDFERVWEEKLSVPSVLVKRSFNYKTAKDLYDTKQKLWREMHRSTKWIE